MKKIIEIEGMHCLKCVERVQNALCAYPNASVEVDLDDGTATIETSASVEDAQLKETVEDLGFDVKSIHD